MTEQLNNNKLEDGFSLKREGSSSSLALGSKTQYSRRCTLVDMVRSHTGRQPSELWGPPPLPQFHEDDRKPTRAQTAMLQRVNQTVQFNDFWVYCLPLISTLLKVSEFKYQSPGKALGNKIKGDGSGCGSECNSWIAGMTGQRFLKGRCKPVDHSSSPRADTVPLLPILIRIWGR